jgi:hypothetical protein
MADDEDTDLLLWLTEVFMKYERDLRCESAWMPLYAYGSDKSFLNVTSLTL